MFFSVCLHVDRVYTNKKPVGQVKRQTSIGCTNEEEKYKETVAFAHIYTYICMECVRILCILNWNGKRLFIHIPLAYIYQPKKKTKEQKKTREENERTEERKTNGYSLHRFYNLVLSDE